MNTTDSYRDNELGVEAGQLAPAHTLGEDLEPPPSGLRAIAVVGILGALIALVVVVMVVPGASRVWQVVSTQTEHALALVLGEPELQTTRMWGSLAGSDADETVSAGSQPPK